MRSGNKYTDFSRANSQKMLQTINELASRFKSPKYTHEHPKEFWDLFPRGLTIDRQGHGYPWVRILYVKDSRKYENAAGLFRYGKYGMSDFRKNLKNSIFEKVIIEREVQNINAIPKEIEKTLSEYSISTWNLKPRLDSITVYQVDNFSKPKPRLKFSATCDDTDIVPILNQQPKYFAESNKDWEKLPVYIIDNCKAFYDYLENKLILKSTDKT